MKAALLTKPQMISVENINDPVMKQDELMVEVKSCGVCATDVKKFTGSSKTPFLPFILGHEPAGLVHALGDSNRSNLVVGDRVAIAPVLVCGFCPGCRSGRTVSEGMGMCENYEVVGFSINGAFCEYVSVPSANVIKIPDSLSFRDAALIEPVAACANGVLRSSTTPPGYAVVLGAGFMGLVSMQIYKVLGAKVIIADLMEDRLTLAESLGADAVINPQKDDIEKSISKYTEGRGVDSVLCAAGSKELSESGIKMLRKGGRIVMMASAGHDTMVEFNLNNLHYNHSIITGSVSYTNATFKWAVDLLNQKLISTDQLITYLGGLDEVGKMLEMTRNRNGIKNVLLF